MRTKTRLTITLSEPIVHQLDNMVNGSTIKNRSHAIETLLERSLSPTVLTAVILAGGTPEGKTNPALTKIGDSPLLTHLLNQLKKQHINRVIICLGKNDQALIKTFGNGANFGLKIDYSLEEKPLGTGGAVKQVRSLLEEAPFLVIHGDVLTTLNLADLIKFHFEERALATIAVKPRLSEPKYGRVFIQGNKISRFLDTGTQTGISIINTGLYIFDPNIFSYFPDRESFNLEKEVFPVLAKQGQLTASIFQGLWYDVSTPASLKEAQKRWKEITS